MLKIRNRQLEVLQAHARREFAVRALAELARVYPEETAALGAPPSQHGWLQERLNEAQTWGVEGSDDLLDLLYLALEFAPEPLDRHPELPGATALLHDSTVPGTAKIGLLYQMLAADRGALA